MSDDRNLLLESQLRQLRLSKAMSEYKNVIAKSSKNNDSYGTFLSDLLDLELSHRHSQSIKRKIKTANFPGIKTLDEFDFKELPDLNKKLVLELNSCDYVAEKKNIILLGNCGTGKTHIAISLGIAACHNNISTYFTTLSNLAHLLMEARDEMQLLKLHARLEKYELLIIDELGYVPLSGTGPQLMFNLLSLRHERCSVIITSNLNFGEWGNVFCDKKLTAAMIDRLAFNAEILSMNGESYRFKQSKKRKN